MIVIGTLNVILWITLVFGGYYYGYISGKVAGIKEEAAKYVNKVKVVKKETVA